MSCLAPPHHLELDPVSYVVAPRLSCNIPLRSYTNFLEIPPIGAPAESLSSLATLPIRWSPHLTPSCPRDTEKVVAEVSLLGLDQVVADCNA